MKLRYRLQLSITLLLACLVAGIYLVSTRVALRSFIYLEHRDATHNVYRARQGFNQVVEELHMKSIEWAAWDDSYRFMKDRNEAYIRSNLQPLSQTNMRLDVMLWVDNSGRLVHSSSIHRLQALSTPNPSLVWKLLDFDKPVEARPGGGLAASGVIDYFGSPMMFSIRPVLTSQSRGPSRGWLVFGRYFDSGELALLKQRIRLDVKPVIVTGSSESAERTAAIGALDAQSGVGVKVENEDRIAGYSLVKDSRGNPLMVLKMDMPRSIYQQGRESLAYMTRWILITGIIFSALVLLIVERFGISRVERLSRQVELYGSTLTTVRLPGRDELSRLAIKINEMLASLDASAKKARDSEQMLRVYSENLEALVAERTHDLEGKNAVLEHAVEGIARLDENGHYVTGNEAYARILGYSGEELAGLHWEKCVDPVDIERMRAVYSEMVSKGKATAEAAVLREDGSPFDVEIVLVAAYDGDKFIGHHRFMKDISERKRLEKEIQHQAFHDALTGLPNRALFTDRLVMAHARALRQGTQTGVLFLDLDDFKVINDSLGHESGDTFLKSIAERLLKCIRAHDTVARLGGDEFTVLMENLAGQDDAIMIAERIVASLRSAIKLSQQEVFASASMGIAISDASYSDPHALMRDADTAMYEAKANGKSGYVIFDPSMNERVLERIAIETGLRKALDREEFRVQYQPMHDLNDGRLSGMEVLLRWETAPNVTLPPGKFVPIAEDTGLIVPIGYWVMRESCRQMKEWQDQYPEMRPCTMNVNLSGRQLQRDDVVAKVKEILDETGLDATSLKLEITESVLMTDPDAAVSSLRELKALGVQLAIDDFGTGYSSMSTLNTFPVDTIKIDRAFVKRLGEEEEAAAIVAAIVMVAKTLGMDVTGEGVETVAQLEQLQSLGCSAGQGYLFDKPLHAHEMVERLIAGTPPSVMCRTPSSHKTIEDMLSYLPSAEDKHAA